MNAGLPNVNGLCHQEDVPGLQLRVRAAGGAEPGAVRADRAGPGRTYLW